MKIVYYDKKRGALKLRVESDDDLWYLSNVIRKGDLIKSKTTRRIKSEAETVRSDKGIKTTITLEIEVENADYAPGDGRLHILGTVKYAQDDLVPLGYHHSVNVEKDSEISIIKTEWLSGDIDRIKTAERMSLRPKLVVSIIDEGDINVGLIRDSGIDYYTLSDIIGGKYNTDNREKRKKEFYARTLEFLKTVGTKQNISKFIIAGAGFEKEYFFDYMKEKDSEFAQKCIIESIGSHGPNGIKEVLKRNITRKIVEDLGAVQDITLMDKLLEHIGKEDGCGVYGLSDVERANNVHAVESLLICDNFFLEKRDKIEEIMREVERNRGITHILNHRNEAGIQLKSLGGIGAILRFKLV